MWKPYAAVACIMLAADSQAQEVADSLRRLVLSGDVRVGEGVYVTSAISGQRLKGDVAAIAADELEVTDGEMTWTFRADDVQRIEKQDSLREGFLAGMGLGAGVAVAACMRSGGGEACGYSSVLLGFPAVLTGAFVGLVLDASRHRLVLDVGRQEQLLVGPGVFGKGVGVMVRTAW